MKNSGRRSRRKTREIGQIATALNLFIGLMIVGVLAIFAYELSRILLVREQLKTCVDIAALSGEGTLLSSTQPFTTAQSEAQQTALTMFGRNTILGSSMNSVTQVASPTALAPPAGQAQLYFEWIDPVSGTVGGPTSNVLRVTGAYSYQVFGGSFMGIGNTVYTVAVGTTASLPAIDLYVCLDLSSSMDDQTPVTWVQRYWDPTANGGVGAPKYGVPVGPPSGSGTLATSGCPTLNGQPQNGLPPQNLDASQSANAVPCNKCFSEVQAVNYPTAQTAPLRGLTDMGAPPGDHPPPQGVGTGGLVVGSPAGGHGKYSALTFHVKEQDSFDPILERADGEKETESGSAGGVERSDGAVEESDEISNEENITDGPQQRKGIGVRKAYAHPDAMPWEAVASAQGTSPSYPPCTFTHLIVNIDGNIPFGGYSAMGYNYPTLGSVVEASIGNLESSAAASAAGLDLTALGVTPQAGYQTAYQILAAQQVQPLATVENTLNTFITKIRYSTDPHFGFVAFTDVAGNAPADRYYDYNVSWAYPQGGIGNFPLPAYHVSQANNNYAQISSTLTIPTTNGPTSNMLVASGGTNTAQALANALNHLSPSGGASTTRQGAARAIVLVTDGLPTFDLSGNGYNTPPPANTPAQNDAQTIANQASAAGIPIYVVALSQSGALDGYMDTTYSDTAPGGLSYISGHGAKYYRVDWNSPNQTSKDLNAVFGNVARQLCSLVSTTNILTGNY